jgi:hypothetical protein
MSSLVAWLEILTIGTGRNNAVGEETDLSITGDRTGLAESSSRDLSLEGRLDKPVTQARSSPVYEWPRWSREGRGRVRLAANEGMGFRKGTLGVKSWVIAALISGVWLMPTDTHARRRRC